MFLEVKGGDRTSVKMQDGHQTGILSLRQQKERANRPFVVSEGLFLKAIAADEQALRLDQTRP